MVTLRGAARLVNSPEKYDRLIALNDSPSNVLELCLGSLQEMAEGDVYDAVDRFSLADRIGYIHFRNVHGKVPRYHKVFVDEGDIDMARVMRILKRTGFEGTLIPDHTPEVACPAPGMPAWPMRWATCARSVTLLEGSPIPLSSNGRPWTERSTHRDGPKGPRALSPTRPRRRHAGGS